MTGKTHQIIGIGLGLGTYLTTAAPNYNPATFAAVLVVSSLGSLLPDLDRASAQIWQQIPLGRYAGQVVDPFIAHRNFSHSIVGTALFGWGVHYLIFLAPSYWGIDHIAVFNAFLIAYISHLLADSVTVQGIPLLFPYKRMFGIPPQPFHGARIVTGKWFESLIVFPLVNLGLLLLIVHNLPEIKVILLK